MQSVLRPQISLSPALIRSFCRYYVRELFSFFNSRSLSLSLGLPLFRVRSGQSSRQEPLRWWVFLLLLLLLLLDSLTPSLPVPALHSAQIAQGAAGTPEGGRRGTRGIFESLQGASSVLCSTSGGTSVSVCRPRHLTGREWTGKSRGGFNGKKAMKKTPTNKKKQVCDSGGPPVKWMWFSCSGERSRCGG